MGLMLTAIRINRAIRDKAIPYLKAVSEDAYDSLLGRRPPLTPPKRLDYIGGGSFHGIGQEFFEYFKKTGLKPEHNILDLGSGLGRMAVPLVDYLSKDAEFHGVDIVHKGVNWSQKNITSKYPNFKFHYLDIYNRRYNRKGLFNAADYRLPFDDESFDFICANSLFTHMLASDMSNYLDEVGRLLKPGGISFLTYFLLNEETDELMKEEKSDFVFPYTISHTHYVWKHIPEAITAYEESYIRKRYDEISLEISDILRGAWCGRENPIGYQDKVIAKKVAC